MASPTDTDGPPPPAAPPRTPEPTATTAGRAPPPEAGGPGPATAQLLLFVGEAARPDAALVTLLAREGLRCLSLPGTEQAVRAATLARFDTVIVDAALVDGRVIGELAAAHRCPIVALAEAPDEVDEIVALELGADLYLARPLAPRRLRAHLRALLRRRVAASEPAPAPLDAGAGARPTRALEAGGWTLAFAQQRLTRGSRTVRLTHSQAAMLRCLMAAAGDIVPAEDLLAALPRHERLQMRSLRVHVHRLRQRLREEGVDELQVEAVRGSGYALALPFAQAA